MGKLSEILGKTLVSGEENLGEISALLFDNVLRTCWIETPQGLWSAEKVTFGKTVSLQEALPQAAENDGGVERACPFTVGAGVYDTNGQYVGQVADLEVTGKLVPKNIVLEDGGKLTRNKIFVVGNIVLIKEKSAKSIAKQKAAMENAKLQQKRQAQKDMLDNFALAKTPSARQTTPNDAESAEPQPVPPAENVLTSVAEYDSKAKTISLSASSDAGKIKRRYGDFNFLIGKVVDKTVVNFQGEVMIRQHETVTKDVLRQAKVSGKLLELYLHIE